MRKPKTDEFVEISNQRFGIYIDNIFRVAFLIQKDTLVLGALGCGVYGNRAIDVINIFNQYLVKYNGCFKKIVFAVYSVRDDNFEYFDQFIHNKK